MSDAHNPETYDYVVVGAGSAGASSPPGSPRTRTSRCCCSRQVPEDTKPELAVPPAWPALWGTEVDYCYDTVAQPGTDGLAHNWPRGKTLGGSSSINAMVYLRGNPADFDHWAKSGCAGLGVRVGPAVLPEDGDGARGRIRSAAPTGRCGPRPVAQPNPLSPGLRRRRGREAGFPLTDDFNGEHAEGAGFHDLSITEGARQSTAVAYLHPVPRRRPNLTVSTDSRARRLRLRRHDVHRCRVRP